MKNQFSLKPNQKLFVISGPSGVGKDTVIEGLRKFNLQFSWVITTTSRKLRKGECEEKPYHFVSPQKFQQMIKVGELIEHAGVYGNNYGTSYAALEEAFQKSDLVILKNDPQGAKTVKREIPQAVVIFILPPSLETIEKRLRHRGTDSEKVIQQRVAATKQDLADLAFVDYQVVNPEGHPEKAAAEVAEIIKNS
jgi:guanylate kinase